MLELWIEDFFGDFVMAATRLKVQWKEWFWLLGNTVQGKTVLSSTPYSGIHYTQSWHRLMSHIYVRGLIDLSKWGGLLYGEKFIFCKRSTHGKQHSSVTFGDSALLRPSKQVKYQDLGIQLEVELKCGTPISLGLEDVVLDPIRFLDFQHYGSVSNLDVSPPVRKGFEDMVADAVSVEKSTDMSTKSGLVIGFKGNLDSINLKEN